MKTGFRLAFGLLLLASQVLLAQSPDSIVSGIFSNPKIQAAREFLDRDHERVIRETIAINEIEAPPFMETARARAFAQMLRDLHLQNVEIDPEGNVLSIRKGLGTGPLIAIAAHLDTVFPAGTNVKVRRDGDRLLAPGIGDNSRSLAVMLAIIRALDQAKIATKSDILFVANVGEEGAGDLRGVKYLFQKGTYKDRIKAFISVEDRKSTRLNSSH